MAKKKVTARPNKKALAAKMAQNLKNPNTTSEGPSQESVLCVHVGPASSTRYTHKKHEGMKETWVSPNEGFKPDHVIDPSTLEGLEDNHFQSVWYPHTLKHLHTHQVVPALQNAHRVLKEDGFIIIHLPNLTYIADVISRDGVDKNLFSTGMGDVRGLDILYGFEQMLANGETDAMPNTGFTPLYTGKLLQEAGFQNVHIEQERWNFWAAGYKRNTKEEEKKRITMGGYDVARHMEARDNLEVPPERPVDTSFLKKK